MSATALQEAPHAADAAVDEPQSEPAYRWPRGASDPAPKAWKFLIYLELPNSHRAPIAAALARTLLAAGQQVLIACEERFAFSYNKTEGSITAGSNRRHIREHFVANGLAEHLRSFDVLSPGCDSTAPETHRRRHEELSAIVATFRPDRVILWNGNFPYQTGTLAALRHLGLGERLLHLEVAWFSQREYIYLDPAGVNLYSSIRGQAAPRLSAAQRVVIGQWIERYRRSRIGDAAPPPEPTRRRLQIFVPLQVDTDTSIREGSPFADMREFISFLEEWIPPDCDVVLKAHPKAQYPYVPASRRGNFSVRAGGSIDDLIARADVVLGINSTVLLEAMALGKRVVTFGKGLFSGCGVVSEAVPEDSATEVFARPIDKEAREDFLYELIYRRQISLAEIERGNAAHLMSRKPFDEVPTPTFLRNALRVINAKEGKTMIRIGKSKVARTASLDVEKGGQITVGDDCEIRHHAVLEVSGRYNGSITIGNHSVVGVGNWLQGSGRIEIGDDVIIGPYVAIVSTNHSYEDASIPVAQQPLKTGEVVIENDVWIGAHCTIAQNVRIGAHSIIGANSFVNKDIPPYSIAVGSPAKVIRTRK